MPVNGDQKYCTVLTSCSRMNVQTYTYVSPRMNPIENYSHDMKQNTYSRHETNILYFIFSKVTLGSVDGSN